MEIGIQSGYKNKVRKKIVNSNATDGNSARYDRQYKGSYNERHGISNHENKGEGIAFGEKVVRMHIHKESLTPFA